MEAAWIAVARRAKAQLPSHLPHGDKQTTMSAVAAAVGLTRQSLRNILAAYDFLEQVREAEPLAYEHLCQLPSASVEIYSRWAKYDTGAAYRHASAAVREGLSVQRVIAAEKLARSDGSTTLPSVASRVLSRLVDANGRRTARGDIVDLYHRLGVSIGDWSSWALATTTDPLLKSSGVAECVVGNWGPRSDLATTWSCIVAVLEIGERPLSEGYRKEAKSTLVRAAAASIRAPLVLVVAPTEKALEDIISALPRLPTHEGKATPGGLLTLAPMAGGIMFTSQERLDVDLQSLPAGAEE